MKLTIAIEEICEDFAKDHEMSECFELTPEDLSDYFNNNQHDRLTIEDLVDICKDVATFSMVKFRDKVRDCDALSMSLLDRFLDI